MQLFKPTTLALIVFFAASVQSGGSSNADGKPGKSCSGDGCKGEDGANGSSSASIVKIDMSTLLVISAVPLFWGA